MKQAPIQAVQQGVAADQWRRVHPISPLLNAGSAIVILLIIGISQNIENLRYWFLSGFGEFYGIPILFIGIAAAVVIIVMVGLFAWLSWRFTSFAVTDQAVWFRQGILFRKQRHTRLERIQSVDIVHPLLGRIFGLGNISIEMAGAADSSLKFGYLKSSQLNELRAEILGRAAGIKVSPQMQMHPPVAASANSGPVNFANPVSPVKQMPFQEAPEQQIYSLNTGRLLGSVLFSVNVVVAFLVMVAVVVVVAVMTAQNGWAALFALWGIFPVFFGMASMIWSRFAGEFNFRAAVSPDGIRIRRGLTETSAQTIPPRRVHAVEISQPWLWRALGWYRVRIDQAGKGIANENGNINAGGDLLLPVGTKQEALLALWLVLPDLEVADVQKFLDAALNGQGPDGGFTVNPRKSRLFDPLVYRRRAVATTGTALVIRDGRLNRKTKFVPFARIQSLGVLQGPWERQRGLSSLIAHTVPGPVVLRVAHLGVDDCQRLLADVSAQANLRRTGEPPERWMSRIGQNLVGLQPQGSHVR